MQNTSPQKQEGAILVISLILLMIVTLVAMSTINTTQLEEKMASNLQVSNQVFQAAEAALEEGVDAGAYLNVVRISGAAGATIAVTNNDARISSDYSASFKEMSIPVGDDAASIDLGAGGATVSYYNFDVAATASIANTGASASHVQGIYMRGLSDDSTSVHKVP